MIHTVAVEYMDGVAQRLSQWDRVKVLNRSTALTERDAMTFAEAVVEIERLEVYVYEDRNGGWYVATIKTYCEGAWALGIFAGLIVLVMVAITVMVVLG